MSDYRVDEELAKAHYQSIFAEVRSLREQLAVDRAACICGCAEHENYDEDGEACADESHQCLRVAPAVLEIVQALREKLAEAEGERDELKQAILRCADRGSLGAFCGVCRYLEHAEYCVVPLAQAEEEA